MSHRLVLLKPNLYRYIIFELLRTIFNDFIRLDLYSQVDI